MFPPISALYRVTRSDSAARLLSYCKESDIDFPVVQKNISRTFACRTEGAEAQAQITAAITAKEEIQTGWLFASFGTVASLDSDFAGMTLVRRLNGVLTLRLSAHG
jgi:hypothetical protein